jgi:S-adenosylmethionine/arginine decarboxylase-like enzyme
MIIRAEVNEPLITPAETKKWLRDLVKTIDMNILGGPYSTYVSKEGNRGVTGIVMIETSHISVHIWDEERPALVQADVYSCAGFSHIEVMRSFQRMDPEKIDYLLLDREATMKWSGSWPW